MSMGRGSSQALRYRVRVSRIAVFPDRKRPVPMPRSRSGLAAAVLAIGLLAGCASVPPPTAQLTAAERAIAEAQALQARGPAADWLTEARARLDAARAAAQRGRHEEALLAAQQAEAAAAAAAAEARRAQLAEEVDSKAARNADLRRRLLVEGL